MNSEIDHRGHLCEFGVHAIAESIAKLPQIKGEQLAALKAVPRPFIKLPVTAFMLPPGETKHGLTVEWFGRVLDSVLPDSGKPPRAESSPRAEPKGEQTPTDTTHEDAPSYETGDRLRDWLPPALHGLLAERVRADLWEDIVAKRSLGVISRIYWCSGSQIRPSTCTRNSSS